MQPDVLAGHHLLQQLSNPYIVVANFDSMPSYVQVQLGDICRLFGAGDLNEESVRHVGLGVFEPDNQLCPRRLLVGNCGSRGSLLGDAGCNRFSCKAGNLFW